MRKEFTLTLTLLQFNLSPPLFHAEYQFGDIGVNYLEVAEKPLSFHP